MTVEIPNIVFTICFHFDGEVDMPLKTFSGPSIVPPVLTNGATVEIDEEKLIKTPVQESLDFAHGL